MSEPNQATTPSRVDVTVSVSSESELHSLAAGMMIARALYHCGAKYIVLGCNWADGEKIAQAEMIPQSEMTFQVECRSNT